MASNATPNGEFTKFGIHLTKDEMDAVRIGIVPDSVLPQLEAALPIVVELSEGMIYRYPGGQTYEIVRIGEEDVILRRVCGFVTVETGTTFAESRAKVEQHFASESKGIEVLTDVTTTYIYV